jgi:S-adenosylmethionine hydrolase
VSIITLTSDFGTKDFSVAAVKATLLGLQSNVTIVDISHEIAPYNIFETAFILNSVYSNFPEKTIHIIGVNAAFSKTNKHLIVSLENHIFIGADNGIFSLLNPLGKIQKIIEIQHPKSEISNFPMKDIFCEIAIKIQQNIPLDHFGKKIKTVLEWKRTNPIFSGTHEMIGHIEYIDRFGNLITDISKKIFYQFKKNKKFEIFASSAKIDKVYHKYDDFSEDKSTNQNLKSKSGMALAIFNSLDLLEIALYKSDPHHIGSASDLLGLKVGDTIKIVFD